MDITNTKKRKAVIILVSFCFGFLTWILTNYLSNFLNPWIISGFVFLFLISFISYFALPDIT